MRTVKAIELARQLGISRRTMSGLCRNDPALAFMRNNVYHIRLAVLATRPGFDLVSALMTPSQKWVKAVDLATFSGKPRRSIAHWCKTRPRFARRLGRVWYVDLEALGASDAQIDFLKRWAPNQRTAIGFLEAAAFINSALGDPGNSEGDLT